MESISFETSVQVTPELLAKAFWAMYTDEQARFFSALAEEVKKTESAYGYGEMQWCRMVDAIRKDKEASKMYMALSAFAFDYWPQKSEYQFMEEYA